MPFFLSLRVVAPLCPRMRTRRQRRRLTVDNDSNAAQRNGDAAGTSRWCGATHSNQYAELQTITSVQRPAPNSRSTATGSASDRRPRDCARIPTGLPTCLSWRAKYDVQRLLHHSRVPEALLMTTRMGGRVPQAEEKKLKEWKQRLDRKKEEKKETTLFARRRRAVALEKLVDLARGLAGQRPASLA
ncbi:hypothetical protein BC567DRAFT_215990 [Phyllosticta citribraziliensis]